MGKVSKRLLIVLLIGAFVIPMFVGCDNKSEDPVVAAKKSFLTYVASEVNKKDVATVTISGTDITVAFKDGATAADIKTAAEGLFDTLKDKAQAGSEIKLNDKVYAVETVSVTELKTDLLVTGAGQNPPTTYEVKVTHSSQSFTVKGNITFTNIP